MGLTAYGSDLSDSMLSMARQNIGKAALPIKKADYRKLPASYENAFDAVVCLSNSINEPLQDIETLRALRSMRAVLRPGGILVFDQGQTDASMQNPPAYMPILNSREFTRLFTMGYSGDIMTVNIFDFIHSEEVCEFEHSSVPIRIRLLDSWRHILREAGFSESRFFGDWESTPYDKMKSQRLICVTKN